MGKILNIETATRICSVALSDNGRVVAMQETNTQNSHAEQITVFSEEIIYKAGISFRDLDAIPQIRRARMDLYARVSSICYNQ